MLLQMARVDSFLWLCNISHTHHIFIHSFSTEHLACFHSLAIVNNAAIDMGGRHISFQISVFVFCGKIPRSEIARLCGSSILSFLRLLHTVFHGGHTNSRSHHQDCLWLLFLPHPQQHLFLVWCMRCYLIVVSSCISLVSSDTEHRFTYLLAICMSSLKKCLFMSYAHF